MPELPAKWTRPLGKLIENRSSRRTALSPQEGHAWLLRGVDGFNQAGIRPFPGFKKVGDLDLGTATQVNPGDFFVGTVPLDAERQTTFYLFRHGTGGQVTVRYWYADPEATAPDDEGAWYEEDIFDSTELTDPMSFAIVGRVVYVFIRGETPRAFYLEPEDTSASTPHEFILIEETGPGPKPPLEVEGGKNVAGTTLDPGISVTLLNNTVDEDIQALVTVNRKISSVGEKYPGFREPPEPHFGKRPGENHPFFFQPGDYVFAYEFVDSRTNRRSQLSFIGNIATEDFEGAVSGDPQRADVWRRSYLLFQVLVPDEWDQVRVYRGVRNAPNSSVGPLQASLYLEAVLTDDDNIYEPASPPDAQVAPGFRRFFHYFRLDDQALLNQEVYFNRTEVDEEMPTAGASIYYEGIMILSDLGIGGSPVPNQSGVGEIRYSATLLGSPELFPPANRLVPPTFRDTPVSWIQAGGNALGLSPSRIYFTRAVGGFIQFEPIANGYGIASRRALSTISELVFYLTSTGIKVLDSGGQLDAMSPFDEVIREFWRGQLGKVFMTYDPTSKVLFTINPENEEALLIWLETSTPTSLVDVPFIAGSSGLIPDEPGSDQVAQFVTPNGIVYAYDAGREKETPAETTRITLLDYEGPSVVTVTAAVDSLGGTWTLTTDSSSLDTSGALQGAYIYVQDGPHRGTKYKISTLTTSDTITVLNPEDDDLTELIGSMVALSPVFVEWVDAPLDLVSPDGFNFGPQDRFRVRAVSDMELYCTDVDGDLKGTELATYTATLREGNGEALFATAIPLDNSGQPVEGIMEGSNPNGAAWGQGLSERGPVMSVGIQVFCPDLDFILVGAKINGRYEHSERVASGRES